MITDEQIRLFSQYCSENFGTELKSVRKSERYQSLPICVLDCVYSLRTKYYAVTVPVLQRYADTYMGGNLYAGQDTLSDFITHIKEFSDCSEFAKTVLKNNQILFRETVKKLKDSGYPDLTVRNLDSVIWNKYQKNRSIF